MSEYLNISVISNKIDKPVFIYLTADGMPNGAKEILEALGNYGKDISLVEAKVDDWFTAFSPWPSEPVAKGQEAFAGKGADTLKKIIASIMPLVTGEFPNNGGVYLCGYSLAGLFSLWAVYEDKDNKFSGAVCCSPSLWYPGWEEYEANSRLVGNKRIYLSLGDKEANTKNQVMREVENAIRRSKKRLEMDGHCLASTLIMNPGGHFNDSVGRVALGIKWILEMIQ